MKVSSIRIKFKEMEKWYGLMEKNMKDLGKIIKCMVNKVLLNGQMEESILETILKTKNMALEELPGPMENSLKDNGGKVYNTVKVV
jgi:hypothetical protein